MAPSSLRSRCSPRCTNSVAASVAQVERNDGPDLLSNGLALGDSISKWTTMRSATHGSSMRNQVRGACGQKWGHGKYPGEKEHCYPVYEVRNLPPNEGFPSRLAS